VLIAQEQTSLIGSYKKLSIFSPLFSGVTLAQAACRLVHPKCSQFPPPRNAVHAARAALIIGSWKNLSVLPFSQCCGYGLTPCVFPTRQEVTLLIGSSRSLSVFSFSHCCAHRTAPEAGTRHAHWFSLNALSFLILAMLLQRSYSACCATTGLRHAAYWLVQKALRLLILTMLSLQDHGSKFLLAHSRSSLSSPSHNAVRCIPPVLSLSSIGSRKKLCLFILTMLCSHPSHFASCSSRHHAHWSVPRALSFLSFTQCCGNGASSKYHISVRRLRASVADWSIPPTLNLLILAMLWP
jgi:hypothetical protein